MLESKDADRVGFTAISADMCFSPVKNATADGVKLQEKGTPAGCAATGEADQYGSYRKILKAIGVNVEEGEVEEHSGVKVVMGPQIVVKPSAMLCLAEFREAFPTPGNVTISKTSSLVIEGSGKLTIKKLNLDGAMKVVCHDGADSTIQDIKIQNAGWKRVPAEEGAGEAIAMRGYQLEKMDTAELVYKKQGECIIL